MGGLVYRADILDVMTGGNPQFPSGNSEPTTIEDWEYMLPLFKCILSMELQLEESRANNHMTAFKVIFQW